MSFKVVTGGSNPTFTGLTLTSPALAPDGSLSAPSYGFANETNTGIFRNGAGTLEVSIAGVNKLDYGVTGAGAWTASAPFVSTSTSATAFLVHGATKGLRMYADATGGRIDGVDPTGIASFQPLNIGGSTLAFNASSVNKFDYGVTTAGVWTFLAPVTVQGGAVAALTSTATFTSGAGAQVGTLTNAPAAGNPTTWIKIVDNGTTRYVPAW